MLPQLPTEIWIMICRWEAIITAREEIKKLFDALGKIKHGAYLIDRIELDYLAHFMPDEQLRELVIDRSYFSHTYRLTWKPLYVAPVELAHSTPVCLDCLAISDTCEYHQ